MKIRANIRLILESMTKKGYLKWYVRSGVWHIMKWRGVITQKFPSDMWNYQEILSIFPINLVIELGARHGGSTLFFADILSALKRDWKILSIDKFAQWDNRINDPRITKVEADSISEKAIKSIKNSINESSKIFAIVDSDHHTNHIIKELELLTPLLKKGDYLVVEDNHVFNSEKAVKIFLSSNNFYHDIEREQKFGVTQAGMGYWIKK